MGCPPWGHSFVPNSHTHDRFGAHVPKLFPSPAPSPRRSRTLKPAIPVPPNEPARGERQA
jgi:hypothetical protein